MEYGQYFDLYDTVALGLDSTTDPVDVGHIYLSSYVKIGIHNLRTVYIGLGSVQTMPAPGSRYNWLSENKCFSFYKNFTILTIWFGFWINEFTQ